MSLKALRLASETNIRDVLLGVCEDDRVEEKALAYLAKLEARHPTSSSSSTALNPASATLNSLNQASEASVRAILIAVCDDDETKEAALAYLAQMEPDTTQIAKDLPAVADRRAGKRKAVGLAICVQCEEAFDEGDNQAKRCLYHAGELQPDFDHEFWSEIDPDSYTETSPEAFGPSRLQGFVWSCCDQGAEEPGCRFSRHVADPSRNKRSRGDDSSLSSWAEEPEASEDADIMGGKVLRGKGFMEKRGDSLRKTIQNGETQDPRATVSDLPVGKLLPQHAKAPRRTKARPRPPPPAKNKALASTGPRPDLKDFMKTKPNREVPLFDPVTFEGTQAFMQHTDDFRGWGQSRDEVASYTAAVRAWESGTTQKVASRSERAARRHDMMEKESE
ncbi:hypothetical protein QBC39DRAFT_411673 [Podospora conica]|nr:hypothetical protein QBC39DRAFT_411673 [Schizothecium conicum]